jgi:hypothetical protein
MLDDMMMMTYFVKKEQLKAKQNRPKKGHPFLWFMTISTGISFIYALYLFS